MNNSGQDLNKFASKVNSVLTGFDRIVFKGSIRPIIYAAGMESFLIAHNILNKDFKSYAIAQSQAIVASAKRISNDQCGSGITYITSVNTRKETLAHEQQKKNGITQELIVVWACVEWAGAVILLDIMAIGDCQRLYL